MLMMLTVRTPGKGDANDAGRRCIFLSGKGNAAHLMMLMMLGGRES